MIKNKILNKLIFFWLLFHIVGYLSFLTGFTPNIVSKDSNGNISRNFLITPQYANHTTYSTDINGYTEIRKNMMFPNCSNCKSNEKDNFYPFHSFQYSVYTSGKSSSGFVGLWGYYGNYEFFIYVIFPMLVFALILLYKKIFTTNKKILTSNKMSDN